MSYNITIEDHNPNWSVLFEREKARLMAIIGDLVVDIQHIGSTSVPGLAAKAIIDLMVGVPSLDEARTCIDPLEMLGYEYRGSLEGLLPGRLFFERSTKSSIRYHILVVEHMRDHWKRYILFRDYLRAHPEEAQRYEQLKRDLADKYGTERHEYSKAKTEYIESILAKARASGADE